MKVIAFNGSPRATGNTSTLIQAVLDGAREGGAENTYVPLDELDVKGCQGCLSCRKNPGTCARKDALSRYLDEMKSADGIVVGCPIYMYHVSGQMKQLVDRLYSFWANNPDGSYYSALPEGKRFAVVTSQGHPDPEQYKRPIRWLTGMIGGLTTETVGSIVHTGSAEGPANKDPELLKRARDLGRKLALGR
jgi:multimeric flavodoxin WrbA